MTMMIRRCFEPKVPYILLLVSIILSYFPVFASAAVVTIDSIEIFRTRKWFLWKPTVYFQCKGENITDLPDVKKTHVFYTFQGFESWQPLTELPDKKCKRCGFYEKDTIKPDDVFDEWEFCASDFTSSDGKYIHFKDRELNATFLCPECNASGRSTKPGTCSVERHLVVIFAILLLVSFATILGLIMLVMLEKEKAKAGKVPPTVKRRRRHRG